MRTAKTILLLAAAAMIISCVADKRFALVRDGNPSCSIVLASTASPSARLAAGELAAYLKKMSGATLPVITSVTDQ